MKLSTTIAIVTLVQTVVSQSLMTEARGHDGVDPGFERSPREQDPFELVLPDTILEASTWRQMMKGGMRNVIQDTKDVAGIIAGLTCVASVFAPFTGIVEVNRRWCLGAVAVYGCLLLIRKRYESGNDI